MESNFVKLFYVNVILLQLLGVLRQFERPLCRHSFAEGIQLRPGQFGRLRLSVFPTVDLGIHPAEEDIPTVCGQLHRLGFNFRSTPGEFDVSHVIR